MEKHEKKRIVIKVIVTVLILLSLGFLSPLKITKYDLHYDNLPAEFDGYRIVHISDFHCKEFGNKEAQLIKAVKKLHPDIIVLTGDIVDEDHTVENSEYLLAGITELAPVYYITGNHEYYEGAPFYEFIDVCNEYGVHILHNETEEIEQDGAVIRISGLDWNKIYANMKDVLGYANSDYFNILLCHDASKFDFLSGYGYDIVFAGHVHGGLMRLPFVGGIFGSDYAFFPKYDHGVYKKNNSTMVCSSGLGDARIPRWNNPREVVFVKLHKD